MPDSGCGRGRSPGGRSSAPIPGSQPSGRGSRSRLLRNHSLPRSTDRTSSSSNGVPLAQLVQSIRRNVTAAVELMTGLEVVEININVNDVHLPDDGDPPADAPADVLELRVR
jgi:hypothetical protein